MTYDVESYETQQGFEEVLSGGYDSYPVLDASTVAPVLVKLERKADDTR